MLEGQPRRKFSTAPTGPPGQKDVDSVDRAMWMWGSIAGALGFLLGALLAFFFLERGAPLWAAAISPFVGASFCAAFVFLVLRGGTGAAAVVYAPSGGTTPHKREYSRAESLVVRGLHEEAVTAFELAVADDPGDPLPYLRVARIYRDHLKRPEDAARWFRRALREASGTPVLARRELAELYVHHMKEPARAAPELARMAEELAGSPEGEWAARELAHVKALMAAQRGGRPDER
jgi:tetratricopeptide (TPR) repeat protein